MSIQIIITGDHSTDVLAELSTLSKALNTSSQDECPFDVDEGMSRAKELSKKGMEEAQVQTIVKEVAENFSTPECLDNIKPKKLSGPQHKIEADKMIDAGKIDDDIFPLLSQRQKDRVLEALKVEEDLDALENGEFEVVEPELSATNAEPNASDAQTNDVVAEPETAELNIPKDDDPLPEPETTEDKVIDTESLKALMSTVCRDEKGNDIPEKYSATRNILRNAVPEGKDIKISNIPAEKLKEVYYSIAAL